MTTRLAALAILLLGLFSPPASADDAALWQSLGTRDHFAIMRHALAPGTGDPDEFDLRDCRTQRNLSEEGREQARRIGARFRANGITTARIVTSQWCRCRETAELLGLGEVAEWPAINSFFRQAERRDPQTSELLDWLAENPANRPTILVTHQVNITALTGIFPASGEIVFFRLSHDREITVTGTIRTD